MDILIGTPLSLRCRLLVIRTAWSMRDFAGTFRVLFFGRTGPFTGSVRAKQLAEIAEARS